MTIIKATCPVCGDIQLSRDQVRLVLHPVRDRSFYSFTCNSCDDEVRKPAGDCRLVPRRLHHRRDRIAAARSLGAAEVNDGVFDIKVARMIARAGVGGGRVAGDEIVDLEAVLD